eukprot:TRINITY_DN10500_c0_g1_i1.p1 TRINITY_DN10500_c0_g1~~TRINITY_DN10500_c0_g1_i1.p1  ORF type:complete len:1452 (-),score=340.55 TRINITY_DN10500_c0_g1_i1:155-4510(-)
MANACGGCFSGVVPQSWRRRALEREQEAFEDVVAFLGTVPLFLKQVQKGEFPRIAGALTRRKYAAGAVICQQGTRPNPKCAFFIIRDGEVLAVHEETAAGSSKNAESRRDVRARLGAGDYFGGNTILEDRPFQVSTVAGKNGAVLLTLSLAQFDELGFRRTLRLPKRAAIYEGREKGAAELCPRVYEGEVVKDEDELAFIGKNLRRNANIRSLLTLKEETVRQVAQTARRVVLTKGTQIYEAGAVSTEIFIIKSGTVEMLPCPSLVSGSGSSLNRVDRRQSRRMSNSDVPLPVAERRLRKNAFIRQMLGDDLGDDDSEEEDKEEERLAAKAALRKRCRQSLVIQEKKRESATKAALQMKRRNSITASSMNKIAFRPGQWVRKRMVAQPLQAGSRLNSLPSLPSQEPEIGRVVNMLPNGLSVNVEFPMEGIVECRMADLVKAKKPKTTLTLGKGESFGELGVLYNTRRLATAKVSDDEDAVVYAISRKDFKAGVGIQGGTHRKEQVKAWCELLDEVGALGSLVCSERRELAKNCSAEVVFKSDELVLQEGRKRDLQQWYVIMSGTAVMEMNGKETVLHRGCYFGERSILKGKDASDCTVHAGDHGMVCLAFDGDIIKNLESRLDFVSRRSSSFGDNYAEKMKMETQLRADYLVDPANLENICELGSGNFSTVYLAEDPNSGKRYAMKRTSKRRVRVTGMQKQLCNERDMLSMVCSDFITRLYCSFQDESYLYMLQEVALGGNLDDLIENHHEGLHPDQARFYAACISFGLEHLHDRRIAHRDMKPGNVLLDEQGWPKICDLGFARFVLNKTYTMLGTPVYMAPEIIDFPNEHDHMVDWWSLGCMTFELLCGKVPWSDNAADDDQRCVMVREQQRKTPIPPLPTVPRSADAFVRRLLIADPRRRIGGKDDPVRDHIWLSEAEGFDKEMLIKQQVPPPHVPGPYMPKEEDLLQEGPLPQHDADDSFRRVDDSDWSGSLSVEDGTFKKSSGSQRGFDAYSITTSNKVVRVTVDTEGKNKGMIRFGLTVDPTDDHNFQHGYWVGVVPSLTVGKGESLNYVTKGDRGPLTLCVDEGQVCVYENGEKAHTMLDGRAVKKDKKLYAKVFVHQLGSAVEVAAFEEPEVEEDQSWAASFKLPEAVKRLRAPCTGDTPSTATGTPFGFGDVPSPRRRGKYHSFGGGADSPPRNDKSPTKNPDRDVPMQPIKSEAAAERDAQAEGTRGKASGANANAKPATNGGNAVGDAQPSAVRRLSSSAVTAAKSAPVQRLTSTGVGMQGPTLPVNAVAQQATPAAAWRDARPAALQRPAAPGRPAGAVSQVSASSTALRPAVGSAGGGSLLMPPGGGAAAQKSSTPQAPSAGAAPAATAAQHRSPRLSAPAGVGGAANPVGASRSAGIPQRVEAPGVANSIGASRSAGIPQRVGAPAAPSPMLQQQYRSMGMNATSNSNFTYAAMPRRA